MLHKLLLSHPHCKLLGHYSWIMETQQLTWTLELAGWNHNTILSRYSMISADTVGDLGYAEELGNYAEYSGAPNTQVLAITCTHCVIRLIVYYLLCCTGGLIICCACICYYFAAWTLYKKQVSCRRLMLTPRHCWMWQHPTQMAGREPCWSGAALPTSLMWPPHSRASFR